MANSNQDQCACAGCDINKITNFNEDLRMTSCSNVIFGCKAIRKFFKNGYQVKKNIEGVFYDSDQFDENMSRKGLIQALTHTLILKHPKQSHSIKFILARYRTCVSIHEVYATCGFYVADNHSMAFLRFKTKNKISCYFVDMTSFEVKDVDINIELVDKDLCSLYIDNGSLWIVQNAEIGVINLALIKLKDNPVRTIVRNFGTMDYWNPNEGKVIFTEFELCHGYLHVTMDSKRVKVIRKQVSTLKHSKFVPVGNRQIVISWDNLLEQIYFEFSIKEDKLRIITTSRWNAKLDKRYYMSCTSDVTKLAVVRVNMTDILLLDLVACRVVKTIPLNQEYQTNEKLHLMFAPNGKRILILGKRKDVENEYFWTQHLVSGMRTLKESASRVLRTAFTLDDIRRFNVPKTLRYELNCGS